MNHTEKILAVLLRATDVRNVFPDWPDEVGVAVCLLASGEGKFVVFRREEEDEIPERLLTILDVTAAQLCIFPGVDGFPTRKVSFSDMCRLMVMLADEPALLEEALDYSTNYSFALEEGIDPDSFLGRGQGQGMPLASPGTTGVRGRGAVEQRDVRKVCEGVPAGQKGFVGDQGLDRRLEETFAEPTAGAMQDAITPDRRMSCVLEWEEGEWVTVSGTGRSEGELQLVDRGRIFLRDDHRGILLRLPRDAAAVVPSKIRIWPGSLSAEVRQVIRQSLGEASLFLDGDFLVIEFSDERGRSGAVDPIETRQVGMPTVTGKSRLPGGKPARRFSRPVAAAASVLSLLLLVGLGLQISATAGPQVVEVDSIKDLAASR